MHVSLPTLFHIASQQQSSTPPATEHRHSTASTTTSRTKKPMTWRARKSSIWRMKRAYTGNAINVGGGRTLKSDEHDSIPSEIMTSKKHEIKDHVEIPCGFPGFTSI